jgi:predicted transcriptional regulator
LVIERPGSTLHDIARDTGLNVGTVRYHMLILSMNHKIAAHHDGKKFVRYFRNAHAYSDDEKIVISLMRREPMKNMLSTMARKDAMTNQEISMSASMQESAVSKYLRELISIDIVVRSPANGEKPVYSIDGKYRPIIENTFENYYSASSTGLDKPIFTAIACDRPEERSFQHSY